jgi:hypothetical protein
MLIDNFNKKLVQMPSSNTNLGLKIVIIAFFRWFYFELYAVRIACFVFENDTAS